jgi:AcrR family transcriptional regulator
MPEHRTKPEHGEQTRGVILAAARRAFAERGYAGTALEDVCAAAGVTRGALYHHYAGKAGVFRAVCEELAAEVATAVAASAGAEPDPWRQLDAGVTAFLRACSDPVVARVLLSDGPSALGWHAFRELDRRHGLGLLQAVLTRALPAPEPVGTWSHLLAGALGEAALLIADAPDPAAALADAERAMRRLLRALPAADPALPWQ